jgi:PII-like signaling protein
MPARDLLGQTGIDVVNPSGSKEVAVNEVVRLRVYLEETDKYQGKPTYQFLVTYMCKHEFAGATVFRGLEGFGMSHHIRSADLLDVSSDLPIVVEILETPARVRELMKVFTDTGMLDGRLVTEERVKAGRY